MSAILSNTNFTVELNPNNFIHNGIHCFKDEKTGKFYFNGKVVDEKIYNMKYNNCVKELKDFLKKYK